MNKTIESDPAGKIERPFKPESSIVVDINSAPSLRKALYEPYDWSKEMPLDYEQTDLTPPHGIPLKSIAPDNKINLRTKIGELPLRVFEKLYVDKEPNDKRNLMTPNLKGFIMSSARADKVRRDTHDDRYNRHS